MECLNENRPKCKPASVILDIEGRTVKLKGGCAEFAAKLAVEGSATAADFAPGCRVSSYAHRCKWRHGLPIIATLEETRRGDGRFARYAFAMPVELVSFEPAAR